MFENPMCLEWKDLEYTISARTDINSLKFWKRSKIQDVDILKNVSGCLNTGEMVAILGPSGAGKTTFLASISQRIRGNNFKGSIFLNGVPITRKEITNMSCYLPQFEITMEALTCFEHLFFMCCFKMDKHKTKMEKTEKVQELLLQVGLKEQSTTRIVHLSGGEKKRLSLAEELINDPNFIFCDEPTTGLDSYSAYSVIKTLRHLTKPKRTPSAIMPEIALMDNMEMQIMPKHETSLDSLTRNFGIGRIRKGVICSIHQPTSDIFELFTHVILMSSGSVVYQGSVDDASLFFSKLGLICPRNCNPAEFYIKLVADENNEYNFHDIIRNNYEQEMTNCCKVRLFSESSDYENQQSHKIEKISWIMQLYILLLRSTIQMRRKFKESLAHFGILMLTSATITIMYSNVRGFDQSSIQDIQGSFFVITTELVFYFSYSIIYIFPEQLPIMRREIGENNFSLSAFYIAQILFFIPKAFISSYIFLALICSAMNFSKGLLMYLSMGLTLSLTSVTATAYGFLLSSMFGSANISVEVAPPIDLFLIIFGGLYYDLKSAALVKYMSMFYYSNEALTYEFWHDVEMIECQESEGFPCLQNGTDVLQHYSFKTHPFTVFFDYTGLAVLFIVMHILAFIFTSRFVNKVGYY